ncbi:MAG: hypothetical protein Q8J74_04500, partial [Candidatus Didemnitutus sp.]|nr:hypothetical protein [Candidatus Didemnitutus sp.]
PKTVQSLLQLCFARPEFRPVCEAAADPLRPDLSPKIEGTKGSGGVPPLQKDRDSALPSVSPCLPVRSEFGAFKGRHRGERCFVVGCAPSLAKLDLGRLAGETVFTVNRGYLAAKLGLPTATYHVVSDPQTYQAYSREIREAAVGQRFYRSDVWELQEYSGAVDRESAVRFPFHWAPTMDEGHFSVDASAGVYRGFTVVLDAVQLAFMMGFAEVYIIGCDLDYSGPMSHVYGTGAYEQRRIDEMPIVRVLQAMAVAAAVFQRSGRVLANAGVGGCLDTIPRVPFSSLFDAGDAPTDPGSRTCLDPATVEL